MYLYAARSLCRLKSLLALSSKKFLSTKVACGAQRVKCLWTLAFSSRQIINAKYIDSNHHLVFGPF